MSRWKIVALCFLAVDVLATLVILARSNSASGRAAGCDQGTMLDCANLAIRYENGADVPKDDAKAFELYRKACKGGVIWACGSLGVFYAHGRSVPVDYAQATPLLKQGCEGPFTTGCYALGELYRDGHGVPVDRTRARESFAAACAANAPTARNVHASGHEPGCDEARELGGHDVGRQK